MNHLKPHKHLTQSLPLISKNLLKSKKYYYHQDNQKNPLKCDLQNMMHHLNRDKPHCMHRKMPKQIKDILNSLQNHRQAQVQDKVVYVACKQLKNSIKKLLQKMKHSERTLGDDFRQFKKMSQQSKDYLQFYLRNKMKVRQQLQILKSTSSKIILSVVKNHYPCLTQNPPDISQRIMLSLHINPLNDFHLVDWTTFSSLHKFSKGVYNKHEAHHFLGEYLMAGREKIQPEELWAVVSAVMGKLNRVASQAAVTSLIARTREVGDKILKESMSRQMLQRVMLSSSEFVWEEILALIFR